MGGPVEGQPSLEGHGTSIPSQSQAGYEARNNGLAGQSRNTSLDIQSSRKGPGDDFQSNHSPIDREGSDREQLNPVPREKSKSSERRRPSATRICGKCGGSLTGQFVRALGDTYHLECFTCHVCIPHEHLCYFTDFSGLRKNRCLEILPCTRPTTEPIPSVRDRLFSATRPALLRMRRSPPRFIHNCA